MKLFNSALMLIFTVSFCNIMSMEKHDLTAWIQNHQRELEENWKKESEKLAQEIKEFQEQQVLVQQQQREAWDRSIKESQEEAQRAREQIHQEWLETVAKIKEEQKKQKTKQEARNRWVKNHQATTTLRTSIESAQRNVQIKKMQSLQSKENAKERSLKQWETDYEKLLQQQEEAHAALLKALDTIDLNDPQAVEKLKEIEQKHLTQDQSQIS